LQASNKGRGKTVLNPMIGGASFIGEGIRGGDRVGGGRILLSGTA